MKKLIYSLVILVMFTGCINKYTNIKEVEKQKYEIIDESEKIEDFMCLQALEDFYDDGKYVYSFPCIKSSYIKVKFDDGKEKNIIDALNDKDVKVEDLDTFNIKYYKTEKNRPYELNPAS
ncbi:MAG: hypothetical protein PUA68_03285 [Bacilli bacterium]|nr:hypothetical protein [Bacilli bacterium]